MGNIEFPHEVKLCLERGADGIGLYRTEFLYLGVDDDPSEETHFEAYAAVANDLWQGKPVVMRTLDLGADKMRTLPDPDDERNPVPGPAEYSAGLAESRLVPRAVAGDHAGQHDG